MQTETVSEKVEEKVRDSEGFGVMVDEYTDVSARKHLAVVGKYIDDGQSKLAFLQDFQLPNGSADTIYSSIKSYLIKANLPQNKLTSFASDGPSVMVGKKNGVVTQLVKENPQVIPVHCLNHRLQLAVSKAFASIPEMSNMDELLLAMWKYYHYSTVKASSLDTIQDILRKMGLLENKQNLSIKKAVHTRWLSHGNAVQSIRKLYVAIVRDLQNAVAEGRDKKLGEKSGAPAQSLLKRMLKFETVYYIHLLCDVCHYLDQLTQIFELETVDPSLVHTKVQSTIMNLTGMKRKAGPNLSSMKTVLEQLEIISPTSIKVIETKNTFLTLLVEQMEERLNDTELVAALAVLDLTQLNEESALFHGDHEITILAEHLGLCVDDTLVEWNDFKGVMKNMYEKSTPAFLLNHLTKLSRSTGKVYPNIYKLLTVHQSLILSTSPVERVFSSVKLVVTDHRNRLSVKTTNQLLLIRQNIKTVEDLDCEKVVKKFLAKKKRRIL